MRLTFGGHAASRPARGAQGPRFPSPPLLCVPPSVVTALMGANRFPVAGVTPASLVAAEAEPLLEKRPFGSFASV